MSTPKILIPVDDSENSANGLNYVIEMASITQSEVNILHVSNDGANGKHFPHDDLIQDGLAGGNALYNKILGKGNITQSILEVALEIEPELIIMNPDVFDTQKKYYEESETGQIIKLSKYPILMIPPNTYYNEIKHIVLGAKLKENIVESVKEILRIFRKYNPYIDVLVFPEESSASQIKTEVHYLTERIKEYTGYFNITGNVSENKDFCMGLSLYAEDIDVDLFCMERDTKEFHNMFFDCKDAPAISHLSNRPFLILPKYWEDMHKKA